MEILAHRGYWREQEERNSMESLIRALDNGFGIETDIRDYNGKLVISHDIANSNSSSVEILFKYYKEQGLASSLALNVKSDGIQPLLKPLIEKYNIHNYFLFDMSVPELVVNNREKLKYFTRHSDIEHQCVMYHSADGVWMDSFYDNRWLSKEMIREHIKDGKKICVVSSELHGNSYEGVWKMIKDEGFHKSEFLKLCTDIPQEAKRYFRYED